MKCKYCGTDVEGKVCTNCGASLMEADGIQQPMQPLRQPVDLNQYSYQPAKKTSFYNKWWFWVIVAIVVVFIAASFASVNDNKSADSGKSASASQNQDKKTDIASVEPNMVSDSSSSTIPGDYDEPGDTAETSKSESSVVQTVSKYEQIYNEYSEKIKNAAPSSGITELAEIANEGVSKMAQYMLSARGIDGKYATYEEWAGKLMNVYINEAN